VNQHEARAIIEPTLEKCGPRLLRATRLVQFMGLRENNKDEMRRLLVEIKESCETAVRAIDEAEFTP